MITAQDVNKLRSMTGAGMMDCKKALTEASVATVRRLGLDSLGHSGENLTFERLWQIKAAGMNRDRVRGLLPPGRFIEVFVSADDETRRSRDPKGLYARARTGKVADFTGVSAPYEEPASPELTIATGNLLVPIIAHALYDFLALVYLIRTGQEEKDVMRTAVDVERSDT